MFHPCDFPSRPEAIENLGREKQRKSGELLSENIAGLHAWGGGSSESSDAMLRMVLEGGYVGSCLFTSGGFGRSCQ